ncbi:histidine kinase [Streptomyces cellulosae]|jgi:two-component system sensor histidine kinase DesK|uniref:Two-component system sensor histidine kinase DesK n=1 Tax=Streptomyces thermodiastaticus TaxID=44061 RepID=A0ABU0KP40_9ACTN|nr:histidine kinase [Streptomyces cellulosae]MDQ0491210.1 two-component system sensor histidine kinase DesK [Streptomyces thermodiastaticus]MXQ59949.1 sensor histidine kinase [Streptomyces sp. XHT-2]UVT10560.1 sensor histidine kinase [Streptomyces thermocarboxydus]WSB42269.1 histidine kinase [Streptomyces cellulosae]
MGGPGGWWRRKSTPAKVETYTRWSFHLIALSEPTVIAVTAFGQLDARVGLLVMVPVAAHVALAMVTASRALDWTVGRRPQPLRLLWALGAATAVVATAAVVHGRHGPGGGGEETGAVMGAVFGTTLSYGVGLTALGLKDRRRVGLLVAGFGAGAGLVAWAAGMPALTALATAAFVTAASAFFAATSAFSIWLLNAVYTLDEARETRARLAVAEERLRFGRDLHDVMGRNLAVIALKSELAVQLARRERPEAVEQMIEVQRIAQETQREVREVVRGYRRADLETELHGAQGVLRAAGIDCEVGGDTDGLPAEVQSALGWVVREATTNVLRHGDARKCTVTVLRPEGRVVLTVRNDGATTPHGSSRTGGTGLAGLRERLSAVDGTLDAGETGDGEFRLVAEVPLTARPVAEVAS